MNAFFKRKICIFLLTFLLCFIVEASVYWIIFHTFFAKEFFLELAIYLIILGPCLLFKSNKYTITYCSVFFAGLILLFIVNITLHYCSRDIFSMEYLTLIGEATSIFDTDYLNWVAILLTMVYLSSYCFGIWGIYKLFPLEKEESYHRRYVPFGAFLMVFFMCVGLSVESISLKSVENENSASEIYSEKTGFEIVQYTSTYLKKSAMKKYGIVTYSIAEITSLAETSSDEDADEISEYLNKENSMTPVTEDYYGSLEGCNVIEIMIETGAYFLIDENLTPNLYKVASQGINFTNNYSKNRTNLMEYIGIAGSTTTNIANLDVDTPYSIPNMLKDKGYTSSYFHNNDGEFYNRERVIGNLGFDNLYFTNDINPDRAWNNEYDGNYPLDSDTMTDILDKIAPRDSETPYYSFWTTLSTHGPYVGEKNIELFHEMGYYDRIAELEEQGLWTNICADDEEEVQNQLLCLQCEMMNLDEAIGLLLDHLEETGQMDNTLLVFYGDHDPYYKIGIDRPLKEYIYDCEDDSYSPQYHTFMCFYNEKLTKLYKEENNISVMEKAEVTDFTSPYLLCPTILELLGVEYNPNMYVGVSLFQTETSLDNIFYSHELGALFTEKIYAVDISGEYVYEDPDTDEEYSRLYLEKGTEVLEKIAMFNKIYFSGYFRELNQNDAQQE